MLIPTILDRFKNTKRLQDHYDFARIVWTQYRFEYVEWNSLAISPFSKLKCLTNGELRNWLQWVNRNIVLNMGLDSHDTIMVKLRIATCMLNKLETIDKVEKIQIHSNLTRNVNYELSIIETEDLPF